jgi:hypothetical protein
VVHCHGPAKCNPIKAFWRCMTGYRKVKKIAD